MGRNVCILTLTLLVIVVLLVAVINPLCESNIVISDKHFVYQKATTKTLSVNVVPFYHLLAIFREFHVFLHTTVKVFEQEKHYNLLTGPDKAFPTNFV